MAGAIHLSWRSKNAGLEKGVKAEENTTPMHYLSALPGEYVWN